MIDVLTAESNLNGVILICDLSGLTAKRGIHFKTGESQMFKEFKDFIMKGNVLELAIAVIIGAAFGKIVTALNAGVIMPIVAALLGKTSFSSLTLSVGKAEILYGAVIQTTIDFIITAFVLFLIVKAYNKTKAPEPEAAPAGPSETDLLVEIRDLLAK